MSSSIKIANRDGERGPPCLVPSSSAKCGEVTLFLITVVLAAVYRILIQSMNNSPKLNLFLPSRKVQFSFFKSFLSTE